MKIVIKENKKALEEGIQDIPEIFFWKPIEAIVDRVFSGAEESGVRQSLFTELAEEIGKINFDISYRPESAKDAGNLTSWRTIVTSNLEEGRSIEYDSKAGTWNIIARAEADVSLDIDELDEIIERSTAGDAMDAEEAAKFNAWFDDWIRMDDQIVGEWNEITEQIKPGDEVPPGMYAGTVKEQLLAWIKEQWRNLNNFIRFRAEWRLPDVKLSEYEKLEARIYKELLRLGKLPALRGARLPVDPVEPKQGTGFARTGAVKGVGVFQQELAKALNGGPVDTKRYLIELAGKLELDVTSEDAKSEIQAIFKRIGISLQDAGWVERMDADNRWLDAWAAMSGDVIGHEGVDISGRSPKAEDLKLKLGQEVLDKFPWVQYLDDIDIFRGATSGERDHLGWLLLGDIQNVGGMTGDPEEVGEYIATNREFREATSIDEKIAKLQESGMLNNTEVSNLRQQLDELIETLNRVAPEIKDGTLFKSKQMAKSLLNGVLRVGKNIPLTSYLWVAILGAAGYTYWDLIKQLLSLGADMAEAVGVATTVEVATDVAMATGMATPTLENIKNENDQILKEGFLVGVPLGIVTGAMVEAVFLNLFEARLKAGRGQIDQCKKRPQSSKACQALTRSEEYHKLIGTWGAEEQEKSLSKERAKLRTVKLQRGSERKCTRHGPFYKVGRPFVGARLKCVGPGQEGYPGHMQGGKWVHIPVPPRWAYDSDGKRAATQEEIENWARENDRRRQRLKENIKEQTNKIKIIIKS